jgi:YD repeat-containing protein
MDWSDASRLIQVNLPESKWEKYYHDGLGRRYKVEVYDGQTTTTRQYVFAGGYVIRELEGASSPSLAREYIGDGRRVLYGKDGQNNFCYAHYDAQGNITSITDDDADEVVFYEYDAFGNLMAMAGTDVLGIGFRSAPLAAGSNLLYFNGYYYDSQTGRGIQPDANERRSLNLYATSGPPGGGGAPLNDTALIGAMGIAVLMVLAGTRLGRHSSVEGTHAPHARGAVAGGWRCSFGVFAPFVMLAVIMLGCGGPPAWKYSQSFTVRNCEIYISFGHGDQDVIHNYNFESPVSAGCQVGCDSGFTNDYIPEKHRIPGANYRVYWDITVGLTRHNEGFDKDFEDAKEGALELADKWCKECKCDEVKIEWRVLGKPADPRNWRFPLSGKTTVHCKKR